MKFDSTIHFGHIIQVIVLVIGFFITIQQQNVMIYQNDKRIAVLENRVDNLENATIRNKN